MGIVAENGNGNPLLTAALGYARRGWRVFPCHTIIDGQCSCGKAECDRQGKHPATRHGLKDATVDENLICSWWSEAPEANVGVATGPESGIFMIGPDGQEGIDALVAMEREHGPLPTTPRARSGSGTGEHRLLAWPSD